MRMIQIKIAEAMSEFLKGVDMTINFTAIAITAIICITLIAIVKEGNKK